MPETSPITIFEGNIRSVRRLMNFDRDVQDFAISHIEELHRKLVDVEGITVDQRNGKRLLDILRGIRTNDSLRDRYEMIFNQAVVLLVSYFGSALGNLFRLAISHAVAGSDSRILSEELSLDVEELLSRGDQIHDVLGDMLILKKDISFQDMQSVSRALRKYFGIQIERDDRVNNIILGQAARHAIVHDGGRANARIIRQVLNARPRSLKPSLVENEDIQFSPDEVEVLAEDMRNYAESLSEQIATYNNRLESDA